MIVFIFKHAFHHYIVPAEGLDDAYIRLAKRQSMSVKRCMTQYELITHLTEFSRILKL